MADLFPLNLIFARSFSLFVGCGSIIYVQIWPIPKNLLLNQKSFIFGLVSPQAGDFVSSLFK